jgi:hypothetical protein
VPVIVPVVVPVVVPVIVPVVVPVIVPGLGKAVLIAANGGDLTKHAFGKYSSEPPAVAFHDENMQAEVGVTPKRE